LQVFFKEFKVGQEMMGKEEWGFCFFFVSVTFWGDVFFWIDGMMAIFFVCFRVSFPSPQFNYFLNPILKKRDSSFFFFWFPSPKKVDNCNWGNERSFTDCLLSFWEMVFIYFLFWFRKKNQSLSKRIDLPGLDWSLSPKRLSHQKTQKVPSWLLDEK
jgi:hypothetical protein